MKIPFDKVYCISYCRNIEKQNNMCKIMKYLGINFEFIYGADYTNLEILKHKDFLFFKDWDDDQSYKDKFNFRNYTHFIGASYDHYTAVLHAYESGANSVLIMEDDCTFINDVSYIEWAFNNYPKDADAIKFGYVSRSDSLQFVKNKIDIKKINKSFIKQNNDLMICFAGCQLYCICNRNTMKKYIDLQQSNFMCCDNVFEQMSNIVFYGLFKPIGIDFIGNKIDISEGYDDIYTLERYI